MNKSQIKVSVILFGIFFPVLASTVFFMWKSDTGFGGSTNKGQLISPVLDATTFGMTTEAGEPAYIPFDDFVAGVDPGDYQPRPWGLVYLGDAVCDDNCIDRLTYLRQLQVRLGPEAGRVKRYYLVSGVDNGATLRAQLGEEFPGLEVVSTEKDIRTAVPQGETKDPFAEHFIYVIDPVGNIMLYFTAENTPEEILSDLDKLLDRSSLG